MLKVSVKGIPVFYAGERHVKEEKLTIEDGHFHEDLFVLIETIEDDRFKGVKVPTIRKALEDAKVEIPEDADRDQLIQLMVENGLTL